MDAFNDLMAKVLEPDHAARVRRDLYGTPKRCICGWQGTDLDGHILAAIDGSDDPTAEPEHREVR